MTSTVLATQADWDKTFPHGALLRWGDNPDAPYQFVSPWIQLASTDPMEIRFFQDRDGLDQVFTATKLELVRSKPNPVYRFEAFGTPYLVSGNVGSEIESDPQWAETRAFVMDHGYFPSEPWD